MGTLVKINQTAGAKGSGRLVKISEKNDPVQPAALPKYQSRRETGTARPQIAPSSGKKDDGYRPSNALVQSAYDGLREGALPATTQFGRLDLPTGAAAERKSQRQTPQKIQREETAQRMDDLRRQELEAERRQLTLPGRVYNEETTAQNRARVQEIDRELDGLRPSSRYNPLMSAAGAVQKGLGQVAQFGGDTLAMAEDAVYAPFELVSGLKLGDLSDEGFFNRWAADIRRENEGVAQFYQRNMELGGKPAEILEGLGASAVAAAPQAALALFTGGGSLGVQTASGLARAAAAELRPGLGTTVGNAVEAMAKNPQFWTAFAQVVGGGYEEAIQDQRDRGETDENLIRTKAALYAVGNGLLNAAVEMGGGIQTLPAQLQGGKSAWRAWVEGMVDEGKEEVVQGILQRSLQNAIYQQDNPLFSTTDEGAILNPKTAAEEFASGAAVGGILGGGQALILSRRAARPAEEYLTEREGILRDLATQKVQGEMELARRRAAPRELIRPETARELLATLGERGERAFRAAYQQESGLLPSFREFAKAYNQGLRGEPETAVEPGRSIDTMAGYFAGQNDAAASLEAEKQTSTFDPVVRKENGLVFDRYVKKTLDAATADKVNSVAKLLGVRVRFVDRVRHGTANAQISSSDILVEKNNQNPVMFLLGHEWTHWLQEMAPVEYQKFRDTVSSELTGEAWVILEQYRNVGEPITYEGAIEEAVANYAGRMIEDGTVLDDFIQRHRTDRTLLEKIRNAIRAIIGRLTGAEKRKAQIAEERLGAALDAAVKRAAENTGENKNTAGMDDNTPLGVQGKDLYAGRSLSEDSGVYSYDFLTALPDMQVTILPEISSIRTVDGRVDTGKVVSEGIKNACSVGMERHGKVYVRNEYTGRELRIDTASIRHGLNGSMNRLLTNARLGAVIGDVVKNAVPINALRNKAEGVSGTYAMASFATDSQGREFVAVVTVEQRSGDVSDIEVYDVTHAVSGRQKNASRADTKSQGVYPSTTGTISIKDFLEVVNRTHQSLLPSDVLGHFGESRPLNGYYTGQAKFSLKTLDGKQIVWIESSPLTNKELNSHKAVAEYIAQHIGEAYTIIESGQKVYIGKELPSEYTQSRYTSYLRKANIVAARAKNRAVGGLGELIETATNRRWEQTKHPQSKDAKYGMYRYSSTFAFPVRRNDGTVQLVRVYDVELLIRNSSDGKKYLYDIVGIKENTTAQIGLTQKETRSTAWKGRHRG